MNHLLSFKSFFHFLGKHKFYTVINVCGLAISLMFVILIAVYSAQELSMDTVSGVMKDIRNSAVRTADIIVRIDNVGHFNPNMDSPTFNNAGSALIYILAKEGTDLHAKADDMTSFFKEIFWLYQRGELFLRLILESTLLSLISSGTGLLLAFAFETYAGNLPETPLFIKDFISPLTVPASLALIVLLGIVAGLVPATIISRTRPIDIMKGNLRTKNKMAFSKILITFQNVITIILLASSITMIWQSNHLMKAPLGYNTKNIIDIPLNYEDNRGSALRILADELHAVPYVGRTSFCETTPFSLGHNLTLEYEGRNVSMQQLVGDSAYFDILGIEVIRDNGLEPGKGWYFSEFALKEYNRPEDADAVHFSEYWSVPVAGVVKDFQLRDDSLLHSNARSLVSDARMAVGIQLPNPPQPVNIPQRRTVLPGGIFRVRPVAKLHSFQLQSGSRA